jgi:hypothetical protein
VAASFSLAGTIRLTPTWTEPLDLVDVVDRTAIAETITLADGDGTGEADCYWKDVRTVAASAFDTIDLSALPLDVYGGTATLDMATVRLIYVKNRSASIELNINLGGGATYLSVAPGGVVVSSYPAAGTYPLIYDSTTFEIANLGASAADYEIVLVGVKS